MLKVPLGAFTAVLGLVAIRGDFVPGLSALDSQQQILAYALLLGFGQQVFTRALDRKAQTLLDGVPSKDSSTTPQGPVPHPAPMPPPTKASFPVQYQPSPTGGTASHNGSAAAVASVDLSSLELAQRPEPVYQPAPDDGQDVVQDDGRPTMPGAPAGDHR